MITLAHSILQKIACHGRVHIGNFPNDAHQSILSMLYDVGHVVAMSEPNGDVWYLLSQSGKDHLIELNRDIAYAHTLLSPEPA
jgi:hypothetical protein